MKLSEPSSTVQWKAQPKQVEFLRAKTDEALFGGAAGGGKSDALLGFAIAYCLKYAGAKILILRRTLAELQKEGSLIPRSQDLLANKWHWHDQKKKWIAPNSSVVEFGYCESERDVYQYQSAQYEVIIFDELTHFTEFQYTYMFSRCRSAKGYPPVIRAATNPGNIGHSWVRRRFIDVSPPGTPFTYQMRNEITGEMRTMSRVFIPARVSDNKILIDNNPGYVLFLQSLPPKSKAALLHGDWDSFEGQYFQEWNRDLHTCKPFQITSDWILERAIDWGMAKPLSCHWYAQAPSGRVYVYREYYITGKNAQEAGRDIKRLSGNEKYRMTYADPSVFARKGEGPESIGEQLRREIGQIFPSKNDRINGWQAVRRWLELAPDGLPWLIYFDTCINAIRTIPELIHDDLRPEDLNSDGEDHAADDLRYWAVMRHSPPKEKENSKLDDMPLKDQGFWERWNQEQKATKRAQGIEGFVSDLTI